MNENGRSRTQGAGGRERRLAASVVCLATGTLILAGCGGWRQTFGLDHAPPDEFAVVQQAPLSLPPDFNLRPPQPGAPRPQDVAATNAAESTVFGLKQAPGAARLQAVASPSEGAFLAKAGAANAEPGIRSTLDAETRSLISADQHWVDHLLFWQTQEQPYTVVNAGEEAKRLKENAAEGKPVTEGETPTIERTRKAPLEGLF
jgi:hypothetical protein